MCCLLTFSGPDDPPAVRQRFRQSPGPSVVISPDPDPEYFEARHRIFDIPYATIFTAKIVSAGEIRWVGVFAFDLLRRPSKWSGLQEASRVLADLFRPDGDGYASGGCRWVVDLAQAFVDPGARNLARQIDGFLGNPTQLADRVAFDDLLARFRQMENHPAFASQLPSFQTGPLHEVLGRPPAEFRAYSIFTTRHDHQDYRGNAAHRFRIVSRADAGHRLLFETQPHVSGAMVPTDVDLSRWFPAYARARCRRNPPEGHSGELLGRWIRHVSVELTGETASDQYFSALADPDRGGRELTVVLGRTRSAGLCTRSVSVLYSAMSDLSAKNDSISFRVALPGYDGKTCPLLVVLHCRSAPTARVVLGEIAAKTAIRLGRDDRILKVSFYHDDPIRDAIHSGYRPEDVPLLEADFIRRTGRKPASIDVTRRQISLWGTR